jgi:hypothetical protein
MLARQRRMQTNQFVPISQFSDKANSLRNNKNSFVRVSWCVRISTTLACTLIRLSPTVERPSAVALSYGVDGAPQPRRRLLLPAYILRSCLRSQRCLFVLPVLPAYAACAACAACGLALFFYRALCVCTWLNSCHFVHICNRTEHFITQI